METINCKNCNNIVEKNYCSNCGEPVKIKRIDGHYILHEIEHVLHFEKGIFYTIKELLIRPGKNVKTFISENRARLVKPIIFIIISSLIYSLISHFFHLEEEYVNFSATSKEAEKLHFTIQLFTWIQNHYGYANIIMGIFIAFWLKIFFRKYNYNFFELLILLCFVIGVAMLILAVLAFFEGLTKISFMKAAGFLSFVYCTWAIGQFFDGKKVSSYVKAFVAYLLGIFISILLVLVVGISCDILIKH
jgi:hypothetical protein